MKAFTSTLSLLLLSSACTLLLTRGRCGNEIIEENLEEECDEGANNGGADCDQECKIVPRCGDGRRNGPEACDDGNTNNNDGCSEDCLFIEPGFVCPQDGEFCEIACGNGVVDEEVGEECEPDQDNCKGDCQFVCDLDEECEDSDLCTANTCNTQTHLCEFPPLEEDNNDCTIDACDPATGDVTNTPQDRTACTIGGSAGICIVDVCTPSICNDGILDPNLEECDDGDADDRDGCTTLCKIGPPCQDGEFGFNGSNATTDPNTGICYIKVDPLFDPSWFGAEADCDNHSGSLISIESAEVQAIALSVAGGSNIWIGLTDDNSESSEGVFVWSDDTPFDFDNFSPGEPNNSGNEDCVEMNGGNGLWNDDDCNDNKPYICELK